MNLTEKQWLQVRTPEFKRWFGDWEVANAYKFAMEGKEVSTLTGKEFQKDGVPLTKKVPAYYKQIGKMEAVNPELGSVTLATEKENGEVKSRGVKSSIAHSGTGPEKSAAFAAVPEIIENGIVYNREKNWKGRAYDSAVIVAPIKIGNEMYIGEAVVVRNKDGQRFLFT